MAEIRRLLTPAQKKRKREAEKAGEAFEEEPAGKWQATVRHPSGKRNSKSYTLKKVAERWGRDQETAIDQGTWVDPNAGKITLAAWREKWLKVRKVEAATEQNTQGQWRLHIEPHFGSWPIATINSWDVEAWVGELEASGVGAYTVRAALRQVSQMFRAAQSHKLVTANPAAGVATKKPAAHVDRILTREEAAHLLNQFNKHDRLMVELLLYCGLRTQEAIGLRRFRVDLLRKRINIVTVQPRVGFEKGPKTEAGVRPIPLTDDLVAKLAQRIPAPDNGYVFTSVRKRGTAGGSRVHYQQWHKYVWTPALEAANLVDPQPTPHDLRHTYGSWLAEAGVPPHQIAALMGHKSLKSVERYIHATELRFEQARAALEMPVRTEDGRAPRQQDPAK